MKDKQRTDYDFLVLGGGSGGIAAANRAAAHGARVALIERRELGGTCVNRGCIPKKIMWNAASLQNRLDAAHPDIHKGDVTFNWASLVEARDAYIARLNGLYEQKLLSNGVTLIRGNGQFVGTRTVRVDGRDLVATHVLVATGGYPVRPDIPGKELGLTSDDFFQLHTQPQRVAIVGSGYIAVELAGMLRGLGSNVTLLTRGPAVLASFDVMLGTELATAMRQEGVDLRTGQKLLRLTHEISGLRLELESGTLSDLDAVIWAIGRKPATDLLGLSTTGITTDSQGYIPVDAFQNTKTPQLYAVGDIVSGPALTPVAISAGRKLADRIFGNQPDARFDGRVIPTVIFSHPPVATVGLSEAEARAQHSDVKTYQTRFTPLAQAFVVHPVKTHMKLVTAGPDERIVGVHMIGEAVDEILQGFAVALQMGARKRDFDATLAIHPTSAEELVTLT